MRERKLFPRFFWLLPLLLAVHLVPGAQQPAAPRAALIDIDGAIGPATSLHFEKATDAAKTAGATLIILRLDTPGGLDLAMRDIIKRILSSEIPVVAFVAPSGARAASAGTYILYASHVAAMAPGTNLGAATPIPVMSPSSPDDPRDLDKKPGEPSPTPSKEPSGAAERKIVHDAVAYIRSLAEMRGRNADWAEQAVREGVSLSAEQALAKGVIELIADDTAALLKQLDGRKVTLAGGTVTLQTGDMKIAAIEPDWRTSVLAVLTNPTVAYILMLIGIYGLLLEGYHPGAILPGVVGAICLLMALYAFQILPINYAGLGLILLGLILIVAEAFVPSYGVMGVGGVIAFIVGSIMLFDSDVPGYDVPIGIIGGIATGAAAALLVTILLLMRSRHHAVVTGHEALLQETAEALEDFQDEGWVQVSGERWRARSGTPISRKQKLRITRVDGLLLHVEPGRPS